MNRPTINRQNLYNAKGAVTGLNHANIPGLKIIR